jgi:hypothetical protein
MPLHMLPIPPHLASPICFKILSIIPLPSTLHYTQLNVVLTQTSTLTSISQVFPTILIAPSRTQPSTPPTRGKPLFTPMFLGGDPNLFRKQT